ncbi:TlpA family protein disulfide reductase [Anditalea andensis]|uniref:Thiol-disulfide oxidoreductase n=1 Tax=Anditalea andensis TaxID=1048983 RepID=A0A074L138_9BACT|nr:TlpA disulfide reductase family protein [Anditalea andensis]KEO74879.1 thiol-disulfide oxidoreductase [Anditalea andensis]
MNWKKEIKNFGLVIGIFALLYFTGWITPLMGGIQSLVLSTGLLKPNVVLENKEDRAFDYTGDFLDENGELVALESFKGKTLFINLWATWCPPCRAEMPHISDLYKKVQDEKTIEFLMIALDNDFNKSIKYVAEKGFSFSVLHANKGLNRSLQSQSIPTTLVISPKGKVVFYQEGMSNFNTKEFTEFLLNL